MNMTYLPQRSTIALKIRHITFNNENNDIFIKLQHKMATFSESDLLSMTAYMKTCMLSNIKFSQMVMKYIK